MAQLSSEEQALAAMSPMDALRMRAEMAAARQVSPDERRRNLETTAHEILSMTPGPGNVMSAEDVVRGAGDAYSAFAGGDVRGGLLNSALAALSGVGAVTGNPFSSAARDVAKEAGTTARIFAGPMSKTADHAALAKAEEMAKAGASRDDIWSGTGWFKGGDGKWRYEIDDSGSTLAGVRPGTDMFGYLTGTEGSPVHSFSGLSHPQLDAAHDMPPRVTGYYGDGMPMQGGYNSATYGTEAQGRTADEARSVILHERQHAVQDAEGFAKGSNPEYHYVTGPVLTAEEEAAKRIIDKRMASAAPDDLPALQGKMHDLLMDAAMRDYKRTAGEVEARNVQARMNMTAADRRATAPWKTQDTPDEEQLFGQGGVFGR
jgi:hypothetical protein